MRIITALQISLMMFQISTAMLNAQVTRHIPAQYATIQAGLNAAQTGDTVLVQPGIYFENIFWPNVNRIKLISAGDTSNTIIDGGTKSTILYISSGGMIDSLTLIRGFRLRRGGNVANGGGIFLGSSSPRIEQCVVQECSGGGIYLLQSSPKIVDVIVKNNNGEGISCIQGSSPLLQRVTVSGHTGLGNGVYCVTNANPVLRDVVIENNNSGGRDGAGLACWNNSNALLERVTIRNNISSNNAGGIFSNGGTVTMRNVLIMNNQGGFRGGGLSGTSFVITDSKIIRNSAPWGAAIYAAASGGTGITLERCLISDNRATWYGGGLYLYNNFSPVINHSTFSGNTAKRGGAIYLDGNGIDYLNTPTIRNSSFCGNSATEFGGGIYCNYAIPNVQGSNFEDNGYAVYNIVNSTLPVFVNNWWGDFSGPYHSVQNPHGKGDSSSTFVSINPFIVSPDTSAPPPLVRNVRILSTSLSTISLAWDSSRLADVSRYRIYYDSDSSVVTPRNYIDVGLLNSHQVTGLGAGLRYYFTVTCFDLNGNESWLSKSVSANTIIPPTTPSLVLPPDSATDVSTNPTLSWNASTGATSYRVQVSTNFGFSTLVYDQSGITGTSQLVSGLANNSFYYWHVNATNAGGTSSYSSPRSFTTIVTDPAEPTLALPLDSAKNIGLNPTLSWNPVISATSYHLQFSTSAAFSSNIINDSSLTTTTMVVGPLSLATTYFWRVRAKNAGGYSVFSSGRRFTTIITTLVEQSAVEIPKEFSLSHNYPNPFNSSTIMGFGLPFKSKVTLVIFNIMGQRVAELVNAELDPGYYQQEWSSDVPSGIYFYRLEALRSDSPSHRFLGIRKMLLLK